MHHCHDPRARGSTIIGSTIIGVVIVCAAQPALAHPTRDADDCTVTILRAPTEVRTEIDRWVAEEHRCKTSLELRVIATEGGFYLLARDGFGREHERIVPDAQTAGVLVASWVADDSFVVAIPLDEPRPTSTSEALRPPGIAETTSVTKTIVAAKPSPRRDARWLTLGAVSSQQVWGLRAELDVLVRGRWSLNVGLALVAPTSMFNVTRQADSDITTIASIARRWSLGPVQLRLQAGGGVRRESSDQGSLAPVLEVAALFEHRHGSWAFAAGPLISSSPRPLPDFGDPFETMAPPDDTQLMVFAGVRHSL